MVSLLQMKILKVRVACASLTQWSRGDVNPGSLVPGLGLSSYWRALLSNASEEPLWGGAVVFPPC